jgi:hypothetical protein
VQNVVAPPDKARVLSTQYGMAEREVTVGVPASSAQPNTPPVAVADSATTDNRTAVSIAVLANDTDAEANALSVTTLSAVSPAGAGTAVKSGNNVLFTPGPTFAGTASFSYGVSDGAGGTAAGSVTVTVTQAPNRPPVANADTATTGMNTAVTINVLANDSDPDLDPLVVSAVTQGAKGTVTINPGGTSVRFLPAAGATGAAFFSYTVSDGRGGQSSTTVTVNIQSSDVLATTQVQYGVGAREWRVNGLGTVNGATITIRNGSTLAGEVIGTATVVAGRWSFRRVGSTVAPATPIPGNTTNRISIESSAGGTKLAIPVTVVN